VKTLYDSLHADEAPRIAETASRESPAWEKLTGKAFAEAILNSFEFRQYIISGLAAGDLAPAVLTRLMDHGWGKPPERVEHTGKDGKPIESITEVRRVIVRVDEQGQREEQELPTKYTTH
jgi:hypothetical protein